MTQETANPNSPLDFTVAFDNSRVEAADPGIRYMEVLVKAKPKADAETRPGLPLKRPGGPGAPGQCARGDGVFIIAMKVSKLPPPFPFSI